MKHTRGMSICGFVVAIAMAVPAMATADLRIYMSPEGIEGDSNDVIHEGWIELSDVEFALDVPLDLGGGTGGGSGGVPILGPVTVRKGMDRSSPHLADALTRVHSFKHIWINVARPLMADGQPFLSYSFGPAFIKSIEWEIGGDGTEVVEVVTIDFVAYQKAFRPADGQGNLLPPIVTGWNRQTNDDKPLPELPPEIGVPDVPLTSTISINGPAGADAARATSALAREEDAEPGRE